MSSDGEPTEKKHRVAAYQERHYLALDIEATGPGPEHKMIALGVVLANKTHGIVLKKRFLFPLCQFPANEKECDELLQTTKSTEWNPSTLTGFWKPRIEWAHQHLCHSQSGSVSWPRREAETDYVLAVTRVIHFLQVLLHCYDQLDLISDNPNYDLGRLDQFIVQHKLGCVPLRETWNDHRNVWCVDSMLEAKGEEAKQIFRFLRKRDGVEHDHFPENDAHCHWLAYLACTDEEAA